MEVESKRTADLMVQPAIKFDPSFKNPCWYENGILRCLPYVILLGLKKTGTTSLFRCLSRHPDFVSPGFYEAQWFAVKRFKYDGNLLNVSHDIKSYADMFHPATKKIQENAAKGLDGKLINFRQITGEKSPSNLHVNSYWREMPGNEGLMEPKYVILDYIHHVLPDAKLIIIFRDPADRLYSDYHHEYGTLMPKNHPNPDQFHEKVVQGLQLYRDCFKERSVRSCVYEPKLYQQTKFNIQLGIHYIFWQEILRLFPRQQLLVLKNEELETDFRNNIKTVLRFLGIADLDDADMQKYKIARSTQGSAGRKPMLPETRKMLSDFYSPFNEIMAELTGDEYFLFR